MFWPYHVTAKDAVMMNFGTTFGSNSRIQISNNQVAVQNPGWFVELSNHAAKLCGAKINYNFVPWVRALHMLEFGRMEAVFNSSYKPDRDIYGKYPMRNGKPDVSRASKHYEYVAYVARGSKDIDMITNATLDGRKIGVETKASIIPLLKKKGAVIFETPNLLTLLKMLSKGNVDAVVGIPDNYAQLFEKHPNLKSNIMKVEKPIKKSIGYVMFSRAFYNKNKAAVECFWTKSRDLKITPWFKEMKAKYLTQN